LGTRPPQPRTVKARIHDEEHEQGCARQREPENPRPRSAVRGVAWAMLMMVCSTVAVSAWNDQWRPGGADDSAASEVESVNRTPVGSGSLGPRSGASSVAP